MLSAIKILNMYPNQQRFDEWHDDPDNWKWGIFYYNEKDPRVWVPKRIAVFGWTLNFAQSESKFIFVGLIAIIIIVAILSVTFRPQ